MSSSTTTKQPISTSKQHCNNKILSRIYPQPTFIATLSRLLSTKFSREFYHNSLCQSCKRRTKHHDTSLLIDSNKQVFMPKYTEFMYASCRFYVGIMQALCMLKFSLSPDILIYTQILCRHVGKMINLKNILNNLVFHIVLAE